jgi:hypothetical protein
MSRGQMAGNPQSGTHAGRSFQRRVHRKARNDLSSGPFLLGLTNNHVMGYVSIYVPTYL